MDFSSIKVFYHSRWSASASCSAPYVSRQPLAGLQGFTSAPRLLELFNRGRSYGSDLKWELNANKVFLFFFLLSTAGRLLGRLCGQQVGTVTSGSGPSDGC